VSSARSGEVWLVDFGDPVGREPAKRRPALIVSDDLLNAGPGGVVIAVPLTTRERRMALHVEVEPGGTSLDEISYAQCEDVRSISELRLIARLGEAPPDVMHRIRRVLAFLLGIAPPR
jgi:mRNA interferase MazF